MRTLESDVCIIGGGITGAMLAAKLAEERRCSVVVVEAGSKLFDFENRFEYRRRMLEYGENAWPGDFIADQSAEGIISRSMAVGGSALHWGGTVPRFSREDFRVRSLYGVGFDWPIGYDDLEAFYCEAERRMGVAGEQGPNGDADGEDPRSEPYPMRAHPLNYNLRSYRDWARRAEIDFWVTPSAKNTEPYDGRMQCMRCDTCSLCPTGAKYSPDFTFKQLVEAGAIELVADTLVRRLELGLRSDRIARAVAVDRTDPDEPVEFRARYFALAAGYTWTSHLLLLSAQGRFADGLANSSGNVGRYMNGHRPITAQIEIPEKIYPGINSYNTLITRRYMRCPPGAPYIRHDLRIFESTSGRAPRLRDDDGNLLLGDALLADWRSRTEAGCARVRGYYDVIPSPDSRLTLDATQRNTWGDPLPKIQHVDHADSLAVREQTHAQLQGIFDQLASRGGGKVLSSSEGRILDHPAGGCRMGADPSGSVCDPTGRTHDHENLYIAGSPTCVTGGCTNGTNTFVALALRTGHYLGEHFPAKSRSPAQEGEEAA